MKVAFLGNMNNNHFAMARFLRDRGVDAEVLLFDNEIAHFHPLSDTYDLSYMDFCRQLVWGSLGSVLNTPCAQIKEDLASYDILIGCGLAPAWCNRIGFHLDIFVPYGDDLWKETFYRLVNPVRIAQSWMMVHYQRRGIPQSRVFHMDYTNDLYESQHRKYKGNSERWFMGLPMVYTGIYNPISVRQLSDRSHWWYEFKRFREQYELMVFLHVRHVWGGSPHDPNQKGIDKLLHGWALFKKKHPAIKAVLVTLEYGKDVHKSKKLIQELGIADSVAWMPMMYRKDLMVGLAMADIACSEFANSWICSGVLYESLAMGKPILAYRNDDLYKDYYPEFYPIMNANDPEGIAERLNEYLESPAAFKAMGEQGRQWYEKYIVEAVIGKYMRYIETRETQCIAAK
ncbi:MAG: Glycosyl transferases group 1 [Syntrophus sp. PtaB.Bin001]|nr:MAG: Glycosyl transferases group 1 [Syntrophus sp. PtaB.Bin001]